MEGKPMLFGYGRSEGVGNQDIAEFLVRKGVPFRQSPIVLMVNGENFTFKREVMIHHSDLSLLEELKGLKLESEPGYKDRMYCEAEYVTNSKRVVRDFADRIFIVQSKDGSKRTDYHDLIMCVKPNSIYERNDIVAVRGKLGKASAQYHSLRSDFLRARALERLRFAHN